MGYEPSTFRFNHAHGNFSESKFGLNGQHRHLNHPTCRFKHLSGECGLTRAVESNVESTIKNLNSGNSNAKIGSYN
jgi:hypothetical protein